MCWCFFVARLSALVLESPGCPQQRCSWKKWEHSQLWKKAKRVTRKLRLAMTETVYHTKPGWRGHLSECVWVLFCGSVVKNRVFFEFLWPFGRDDARSQSFETLPEVLVSLFAAKGRCDHFQNHILRYLYEYTTQQNWNRDVGYTFAVLHCLRLLFDEIPNEGESFADGLVPEKALRGSGQTCHASNMFNTRLLYSD